MRNSIIKIRSMFAYERYTAPSVLGEYCLDNITLAFSIIKYEKQRTFGITQSKLICNNLDNLYIYDILCKYLTEENKFRNNFDINKLIKPEAVECYKMSKEEYKVLLKIDISKDLKKSYKKLDDKFIVIQDRQEWDIACWENSFIFRRRLAVKVFEDYPRRINEYKTIRNNK